MENSFAGRLESIIDGSGLSLEGFGAKIGYGKSYLSRLRAGKCKPPELDFFYKVEEAFNVPVAWLRDGTGESVSQETVLRPEGFPVETLSDGPAMGISDRMVKLLRAILEDCREGMIGIAIGNVARLEALDGEFKNAAIAAMTQILRERERANEVRDIDAGLKVKG